MRASDRQIIQDQVNFAAGQFRTAPRGEYLSNLVEWLVKGFTPRQSLMLLERAAESLPHFPSIAELKTIAEFLQKEKPSGTTHGRPIFKETDIDEIHPWPNSVIGLIMGFDDRRVVSPYSLSQLGLTHDEAEFLFRTWKAGDWHNEWALEIIEKAKTESLIKRTLATVRERMRAAQ